MRFTFAYSIKMLLIDFQALFYAGFKENCRFFFQNTFSKYLARTVWIQIRLHKKIVASLFRYFSHFSEDHFLFSFHRKKRRARSIDKTPRHQKSIIGKLTLSFLSLWLVLALPPLPPPPHTGLNSSKRLTNLPLGSLSSILN